MKLQIVIDGKTYEVEYDTSGEHTSASAPPLERVQSLVLPTPRSPGTTGAADIDESKLLRSPVAGIVARINVKAGQSVQAGDILVVVEAMKMENNLSAESAGRVKSVKVEAGDTVKVNQIVVEFE